MEKKKNKNYLTATQKQVDKLLAGKEIKDLGTIIIENDHDKRLADKYIEELRKGNTLYRPEGLKIVKE